MGSVFEIGMRGGWVGERYCGCLERGEVVWEGSYVCLGVCLGGGLVGVGGFGG